MSVTRLTVDPHDRAALALALDGEITGVIIAPMAPLATVAAILHLAQFLGAREPAPRLVTLTRGAQAVATADNPAAAPSDPAAALAWGLHRTLAFEHTELRPLIIDLDPAGEPGEAGAILAAALSAPGSPRVDELARRGGGWWAPSLARVTLAPPAIPALVRGDASYLLVGGLGGLGLLTARWLVEAGARHLVLASRRAALADAPPIEALRSTGATVVLAALDATDGDAVTALLARIDAQGPPLRGVFHLAGVLDDGLIATQTVSRMAAVVAPKLDAARHLDRLTRGRGLDHFVLYSSAAALLGAPGLGSYAAANAALAALAQARRAAGEAALAIEWGLFSGVGMGRIADAGGAASSKGLRPFAEDEAGAVFLRLLALREVAEMGAIPLDVQAWVAGNPAVAGLARFAALVSEAGPVGAADGRTDLPAALAEAPVGDRPRVALGWVRRIVAGVLGLDAERLDPERPLQDLGLDSVMGLDLRNRLGAALGVVLPATLVWTFATTAALAGHLLERWQGSAAESDPTRAPIPSPATPRDDLLAAFDAALDDIDDLI